MTEADITVAPGAGGREVIGVRGLGVKYSLRFTRKTTLRQSFANVVLRHPPEQFWAL